LRRLRAGDEAFLAMLDSDPEVMRYIHTGPGTQAEAFRYAQLQVEMADTRHFWGKWMVVSQQTQDSLGWVELSRLRGPDRDDLQVGYEFARVYWGHGYATEAAARVVEYAFAVLNLDRLGAVVRPENTASVRVLEKLGFAPVGNRMDEGRNLCDEYRLTLEAWRELGGFPHVVQ
jgi:RimJ/RimL family protein N-acetyltransferase